MRRIGCINWDSLLPRETYFGGYTLRALENTPERMPYCAVKGEKGWDIPVRTQEEYDKELQYAIDAGVDYFAHCWYPRKPIENPGYGTPGMDDLAAPICELGLARKLHMGSALLGKIKLCAIIAPYRLNEEDREELCDAMKQEWYEKTADGRPLLFVFEFYKREGVEDLALLMQTAKKRGVAPYVVGMCNNPADLPTERRQELLGTVDALSAYAQCSEGIATHEQLISDLIEANEGRASWGKPIVPFYTMGWSPIPRIKSPVPWCGYADVQYAGEPSEEERIAQAKRFKAWMEENADKCEAEHLLTFAWNEFEEGGWICPTLDENGGIDTTKGKVYNTISHIFRG